MEVTTRTSGDVTIVERRGKMTAERGVAQFAETIHGLLDNGQTRIVLDMDASYIDDAGINEIIIAHKAVQGHGGTIKLLSPFRRIGPGLTVICKLLIIFETFDDEAKAIASFGGDKA